MASGQYGVGEPITLPWLDYKKFVVSRIVQGGMGTVYQLVPVGPGYPTVALKTLQASIDPAIFESECEIWLKASDHPGIAKAMKYGELDGRPTILSVWYPHTLADQELSGWPTDMLEGLDGQNGYSLEAHLEAMVELRLEREMESMEKESRRLGFKGALDETPDPGMREAIANLYRLYASNAKVCAAAVKKGDPFPFQKLYEQLGPGFGRQADGATLAARFDDVVQPLVRDLRQKVAKAFPIQ